MSFQVGLTELERAREVAERALRTIEMSQEAERFNVWAALLNFEKAHGSDQTFLDAFRRAVAGTSSPHRVHLHAASLHERAGDATLAYSNPNPSPSPSPNSNPNPSHNPNPSLALTPTAALTLALPRRRDAS